ncbi:putative integral membrane protein [Aspergillus novofumigatus IBT 16806]|uniref:Putative integral membrane protein n=1 Tax=Aspergillus novofumigatus (strain IBT 16806) TaxID=1392255 RepID=A0A2I1CC31_ASPN1|nr:putative integral membrane protein [Aspergillus novofumigatus IBT 16806]PKX95188.1 putative integral membrane protein [Aspergillus novofumigatus IBT 16806]
MSTTRKDDRSLEVKVVAAVFVAIASVTVMLRCYVRLFVVKAFGWDDGAMVIAMLWYFMFSGCMIGGALYGTGRRFANLTAHQRVTAMEYWWLCEIAYCWASVSCKVSVCIFLRRITVKRLHIWILYCVIALTAIAGLAFMLIMLLQCKPIEYFWTRTALDPSIPGSCISIHIVIAMTYVYSAFAALCDFTVGILPIFMVRKLHMRRQTKIAVIGILSMACIASSAVIIRIPWVGTFADPDFLYATVDIALWSNIEVGLGISAGSLATLRPLLRMLRGTNTTDDYMSPMPGQSSSRRLGPSRDRPVPLGSLDTDGGGRFRPDKLATTVTTVHAPDSPWRGSNENSSEERLNSEGPVADGGDMGLGIHRTFEVTQTSEAKSASVREHV